MEMPSPLSIENILDGFSNYMESKSKSRETVRAYISDIRLASKSAESNNPDLNYLLKNIESILRENKEGLKEATIARRLSALNIFSAYLFKNGLTADENYFNFGKRLSFIYNRPIKEEEFEALLKSVPKEPFYNLRFRSMACLAYNGLSLGEVCRVEYPNFLKEEGELKYLKVKKGENKKNERVVKLEDEVSKELGNYEIEYLKNFSLQNDFFLNRSNRKLGPRYLTKEFEKFKEISKIDSGLNLTSLRYAYAKRLLERGDSEEQIAYNLGLKIGSHFDILIKKLKE